MTWTMPYCGVSHLVEAPSGYQFTITERPSFAEAVEFPLRNQPFTNFTEQQFDTVAEARAWCERRALALQGGRA